MLKDKNILIGVSGGISCYKTISLARNLKKMGANVRVLMTENASQFISPLVFESLTKNKCLIKTFGNGNIEHIESTKNADIFLIAPATANIIAKIANGIADDMLTTSFLATNCTKIVCPAMNTNMYENSITQDNIKKLKKYNIKVVDAEVGELACNVVGKGKMAEPEKILSYIEKEISKEKTLKGKKILVTAGATREYIDPVRFISNPSSGKMGMAIAKMCMLKGAEVTVVCGEITAPVCEFINIKKVTNAKEMFEEVKKIYKDFDIIFKTAAVADFTPKTTYNEKVKKDSNEISLLELEKTEDILKFLGENKGKNQILCGFAMETQNLLENAKKKLINKNLDYIVANNLKIDGAGFKSDTNVVTIISKNNVKNFPKMCKQKLANEIIDYIQIDKIDKIDKI